jgi:hypothetical protein
MVCFWCTIVNTLHKGDNKFNNNNNNNNLKNRMCEGGTDPCGSKQGLLACSCEGTTETSG